MDNRGQNFLLDCNYLVLRSDVHDSEFPMRARPRDLADQMSGTLQPKIFTLPLDPARCKAREIIDQSPESDFTPIIEKWRNFRTIILNAIRHFPAAD